jgi:hypothetical protein
MEYWGSLCGDGHPAKRIHLQRLERWFDSQSSEFRHPKRFRHLYRVLQASANSSLHIFNLSE